MSLWKIYRYEDTVLVPRMVQTDAGVFLETEPVELIAISDPKSIREVLAELLDSKPGTAEEEDLYNEEGDRFAAQSVLLTALSLKKWQDFERRALLYTMHKQNDELKLHVTGRGNDGLWSLSGAECKSFELKLGTEKLAEQIASEIINKSPVPPPRLLGGPVAMRLLEDSEKKD